MLFRSNEATQIAKQLNPGMAIDGEMQFDAAVSPTVGQLKFPGSPVAGYANTFIFPLIEAGATRLRPILMTTLTTIVSMIPMALAYGDSGKSMQGLALVDVGGLVASTVLALLMLPIYYEVMSPKKKPEPHYD